MMKIFLFAVASILLINCSKDDKVATKNCNCDNPMEDLAWLKSVKDSLSDCPCRISVIQATYQHQEVFYLTLSDPLCDGVSYPALLDCSGKLVKQFTMENMKDFDKQVTVDSVVYSCR
jgi:hypothetical protein